MMQHVAPVHIHTILVSGATIIEQFLFIGICTFAMICLIPGSDGPIPIGSPFGGSGSQIRGGGSQTRGAGAEIRRDPAQLYVIRHTITHTHTRAHTHTYVYNIHGVETQNDICYFFHATLLLQDLAIK